MPESHFDTEEQAIQHLIEHADVNELVQSIGRSGWLDFEPLIVRRSDQVVIEGNRRLAAIRLLSDPRLREAMGYKLPSDLPHGPPPEVRAFVVDSRASARDFIGFKHINGAYKWDSLAKAKYAVEWLDDEPTSSVREVSERLGDGHNTVLRLVNAYQVLRQAEAAGFSLEDVTARRGFSFSHLYTALPSPSVRTFLGISEDASAVLPPNPVPDDHVENLRQYMVWLFGQRGQGDSIIRSQNPDLGRLNKVLASSTATRRLTVTSSLDEAYDVVEDKAEVFANSIYALLKAARDTSQQLGNFDGDPEVLTVARTAYQTVRRMYRGMEATNEDDLSEK